MAVTMSIKKAKVKRLPPGWVPPEAKRDLMVRAATVDGRPHVDINDLAAFLEESHPDVSAWLLGAVPHIQ